MKVIVLLSLALASLNSSANAAEIEYQANFSGVVTQAPAGNLLQVSVGDPVFGHVMFESELINFAPNDVITTPDVTLQVGLAAYEIYPGDAATLSIAGNRLIAVGIFNPEGVDEQSQLQFPDVFLDYDRFFTEGMQGLRECASDSVCGNFDFSNSFVTARTPEPAAWFLMPGALAFLLAAGLRRWNL